MNLGCKLMPFPPLAELKDSLPLIPAGSGTWDVLSSKARFHRLTKGALQSEHSGIVKNRISESQVCIAVGAGRCCFVWVNFHSDLFLLLTPRSWLLIRRHVSFPSPQPPFPQPLSYHLLYSGECG